jgi:probable phosphoglycerate mutase
MTGPVLAGWTPGVHLDERGQKQADAVAERLAPLPFVALVTSPLERCTDTIGTIARRLTNAPKVQKDKRIAECRYGDWTGRALKDLAKEPMWKVVQAHPSAAIFPGGEGLADVQARAVGAVRDHDTRLRAEHGDDAVWLACSHGDVIKSIVADALGLHLDLFQRITIDPCSVTVIRYTELRPFVVRVNDTGGDVAALVPAKKTSRRSRKASSDAVVGGGAG